MTILENIMETIQIQHSLISIFDIEQYSKRTPENQKEAVIKFVEYIEKELRKKNMDAKLFSTGDGAIVSIHKDTLFDSQEVRTFVKFVIDTVLVMKKKELVLRASANYSLGDSFVKLSNDSNFDAEYIQTGDSINIASRIINFCESREIMID